MQIGVLFYVLNIYIYNIYMCVNAKTDTKTDTHTHLT